MDGQSISLLHKPKRILGLSLFWLSRLLWALVIVVPFVLDAEVATIAMISTSLLVAAESVLLRVFFYSDVHFMRLSNSA